MDEKTKPVKILARETNKQLIRYCLLHIGVGILGFSVILLLLYGYRSASSFGRGMSLFGAILLSPYILLILNCVSLMKRRKASWYIDLLFFNLYLGFPAIGLLLNIIHGNFIPFLFGVLLMAFVVYRIRFMTNPRIKYKFGVDVQKKSRR